MGTEKEVKFEDKLINVTVNPIMIIGQNPGRQRSGQQTNRVWEGNKSSDLLNAIISPMTNLYLTNVCNYQQMTLERVREGLDNIVDQVQEYEVTKVVCLGEFAYKKVKKLGLNVELKRFLHPSYIVRFNRDSRAYMESLREELV